MTGGGDPQPSRLQIEHAVRSGGHRAPLHRLHEAIGEPERSGWAMSLERVRAQRGP